MMVKDSTGCLQTVNFMIFVHPIVMIVSLICGARCQPPRHHGSFKSSLVTSSAEGHVRNGSSRCFPSLPGLPLLYQLPALKASPPVISIIWCIAGVMYQDNYQPAQLCCQWTNDVELATCFTPLIWCDIADILKQKRHLFQQWHCRDSSSQQNHPVPLWLP